MVNHFKTNKLQTSTLMVAVVSTFFAMNLTSSSYAQESINLEEVRKELQAAKAVSGRSSQLSQDSFSLDESDMQKKRAALLAAENALLDELGGSTPIKSNATTGSTRTPSQVAPTKAAEPPVYNLPQETAETNEPLMPVKEPVRERVAPQVLRVTEERVAPTEAITPVETISPRTRTQEYSEPTTYRTTRRESPSSASPLGDLEKIKNATMALESELSTLRKNNSELATQLRSAKSLSASLQRSLEETRDRLMIAESEVERISGVMKTRSQESLSAMGATIPASQRMEKPAAVAAPQVALAAARRSEPRVAEDVLIGTVVAEKANLRTGPGKDNSPFMTVPRGSRLTVETRRGDWYRVITPTGTRAWVASEVLAFGENGLASPSRTVRIRGYDSSLENETFKIATGITPR